MQNMKQMENVNIGCEFAYGYVDPEDIDTDTVADCHAIYMYSADPRVLVITVKCPGSTCQCESLRARSLLDGPCTQGTAELC